MGGVIGDLAAIAIIAVAVGYYMKRCRDQHVLPGDNPTPDDGGAVASRAVEDDSPMVEPVVSPPPAAPRSVEADAPAPAGPPEPETVAP